MVVYRKSIQHSSPPSSNQALQLNNTSILNGKILLFWLLLTSKNKSCTKSMSFRATNKHSCTKFFAISAIHLSFKRDIRRLRNFLVSKHLLDLMLNEVLAVIDYGICTMFSLFSVLLKLLLPLLACIYHILWELGWCNAIERHCLGNSIELIYKCTLGSPLSLGKAQNSHSRSKGFLSSFKFYTPPFMGPFWSPLDPSSIWSYVESSHSVQSIITTAWIKQKEETSIILLSHLIK